MRQTRADTKFEPTSWGLRHLLLNNRERAVSGLRIVNDNSEVDGQATAHSRPIIDDIGDVCRFIERRDNNRQLGTQLLAQLSRWLAANRDKFTSGTDPLSRQRCIRPFIIVHRRSLQVECETYH